jgi:hypothetical protein
LLDLIRQAEARSRAEPLAEASLDVGAKLRAAVAEALKRCPLSRYEVAGKLSLLVGRSISKDMLDAWTAGCDSHQCHRIPGEYLPALCVVTGSREPLQILAEAAGMFALPGPDALRAEIRQYEEKERAARAEKRKREVFLKEMEGKG